MVLPDEAIPETPIKIGDWSSRTGIGGCKMLRISSGGSSLSAGSSFGSESSGFGGCSSCSNRSGSEDCTEDAVASTGRSRESFGPASFGCSDMRDFVERPAIFLAGRREEARRGGPEGGGGSGAGSCGFGFGFGFGFCEVLFCFAVFDFLDDDSKTCMKISMIEKQGDARED